MIDSLWIALATYSRLPTKRVDWKPESLRYSLCFFPLVGVAVGALELLWLVLALRLHIGAPLLGAVGCAIPILVSGGIHMDGFMDTLDALSSRRPREEMLRILKDPNAGAFAVMGCALYLIADAAALSSIDAPRLGAALACGFVLSRALSAYLVVTLGAARRDGMAASVKQAVDGADDAAAKESGGLAAENASNKSATAAPAVRRWSAVWAAASALLMLWAAPVPGLIALIWAAASVILYLRVARRFGGVTGDLAGWFLQVCELGVALAVALGGRI